jgi:hypothetical protein
MNARARLKRETLKKVALKQNVFNPRKSKIVSPIYSGACDKCFEGSKGELRAIDLSGLGSSLLGSSIVGRNLRGFWLRTLHFHFACCLNGLTHLSNSAGRISMVN